MDLRTPSRVGRRQAGDQGLSETLNVLLAPLRTGEANAKEALLQEKPDLIRAGVAEDLFWTDHYLGRGAIACDEVADAHRTTRTLQSYFEALKADNPSSIMVGECVLRSRFSTGDMPLEPQELMSLLDSEELVSEIRDCTRTVGVTLRGARPDDLDRLQSVEQERYDILAGRIERARARTNWAQVLFTPSTDAGLSAAGAVVSGAMASGTPHALVAAGLGAALPVVWKIPMQVQQAVAGRRARLVAQAVLTAF
ncbi:hypothetical protein [Brevundimonas sp.]|uniref:hypothetical protein n=1 Tax=Brevundimonas sp. TaxID=1871086 RepID=UPI0035B17AC1